MSRKNIHNIRRGAVLVASFVFSACAPVSKDYVNPADISYQDVPGYDAALKAGLYEWSAIHTDTANVQASLQAPRGLRLRWLGTAGFELSDDSTAILIDPFVSRPVVRQLVRGLIVDTAAVNRYVLAPLPLKNLKAILISHAHYDHFQDVPYILAQFPDSASRPVVVGGRDVFRLLQGFSPAAGIAWLRETGGLPDTRMALMEFSTHEKNCLKRSPQVPCAAGSFGDFKIHAFGSDHPSYDYLSGVAIDGSASGRPPYHAAEYKTWLNTSIGFLIEYRGLRLFFAESPIVRHADQVGRVDVLIQGIAARRDCDFIASTLAALQPRYIVPSHYDDFFKPLSDFKKFDARIGIGPVDFSRFDDFVRGYEEKYVVRARSLIKAGNRAFHPHLRLLKLFYYYSLEGLIPVK